MTPCLRCGTPRPAVQVPPYLVALVGLDPTSPPPAICDRCREEQAAQEARERLAARLQRAGIPERYRGWSFDEAVVATRHEFVADLRERLEPKVLGVLTGCNEAMEGIAAWRPGNGWGYLEGEVGSGKTLLACCLAEDLLSTPLRVEVQTAEGWEEGEAAERQEPRGALRRKSGGWSAQLLGEGEMFARQRQDKHRAKGQRTTMQSMLAAEVLVWDDLGTALEGAGKAAEWRQEWVEELIDGRYRRRAPTVFTSNHALTGLAPVLGERAAGRVVEMVGERRWVLSGNWRAGRW